MEYDTGKFKYAMDQPGLVKDYCFLVRNAKNKKIMATIMGIPKKFNICGQNVKMFETNFLSVHRNLRGKRMAQIMI